MVTIIIGSLCILFGLFVLFCHLTKRLSSFGKLSAMQENFGQKTGTAIHLVCYSILPILIGALVIYNYCVNGFTLF